MQVYANDLNPCSHQWLQVNVKLNKVMHGLRSLHLRPFRPIRAPRGSHILLRVAMGLQVSKMVNSYCMDGRDFVRLLCDRPLHAANTGGKSSNGSAEEQATVQVDRSLSFCLGAVVSCGPKKSHVK